MFVHLFVWSCIYTHALSLSLSLSHTHTHTLSHTHTHTQRAQGRNVILDQTYGPPRITKDGVSVAKEIEFKDRSINLGAQLVRSGV